jgi:hypothetical protein
MRRKLTILATVLLALVFVIVYAQGFLSDSCLKVALGIKSIPSSVTNQHTNSHGFTDEIIEAYFEASSDDMTAILSVRDYQRVDRTPLLHANSPSIYPLPVQRFFPDIAKFEVADFYSWESTSGITNCRIWVDPTRTKAFVVYATD